MSKKNVAAAPPAGKPVTSKAYRTELNWEVWYGTVVTETELAMPVRPLVMVQFVVTGVEEGMLIWEEYSKLFVVGWEM